MIDIHCHILPDIDDGPKTFEESVAMAKIAGEDGITTIVATPHVNTEVYDQGEISRRVSHLNHLLKEKNIPVTVLCGADVATTFPADQVKQFTINNTSYILVEFPHTHLPRNAEEIIFNYKVNGLWPIITHPERNPSIAGRPEILLDILSEGIHVQITSGSLTGDFGRDALHCAQYLLRKGVVDVIATDAHSALFRKPVLSGGLKEAGKIIGDKMALKMVTGNPEKILSSKRL